MRKAPLSPHLQIYKLPLNALLSISHRITGVILVLAVIVLVGILAALALGEGAYSSIEPLFSTWFIQTLIYLAVLVFFFHFYNGMRHLLWDNLIGLNNESVKISSVVVLIVTLLTFGFWWQL